MDNMIINVTHINTNKIMQLKIEKHLYDRFKTDFAAYVLHAYIVEILRRKSSGNLDVDATGCVIDMIQSIPCFGGAKPVLNMEDKDGNILMWGLNGEHSFIKPKKKKLTLGWKIFLNELFKKEPKNTSLPMATKISSKKGDKK